MDDREIIGLYWQRDERAISETSARYGSYCLKIARNILEDIFESEECVNDTWLRAWNSMPPHKPDILSAYLGKITRNLALSRYRERLAYKRGGGEASLALEELNDCVPSRFSVEDEAAARELGRRLNAFVATLGQEERDVFVSRYWFGASIALICERTGSKSGRIKSMLHRTRRRLLNYLEEDAYDG